MTIPELEKREPLARDMSLRDWFAGHALAGLIAHGTLRTKDGIVAASYEYADAVMKEREK
jgi:hypothetical protein